MILFWYISSLFYLKLYRTRSWHFSNPCLMSINTDDYEIFKKYKKLYRKLWWFKTQYLGLSRAPGPALLRPFCWRHSEMNLAPISVHFIWKNTERLSTLALRVVASHTKSEHFWIQHRISFPLSIINRGWYKHDRHSEHLSVIMFLIHLILSGFYLNFLVLSYICFLR